MNLIDILNTYSTAKMLVLDKGKKKTYIVLLDENFHLIEKIEIVENIDPEFELNLLVEAGALKRNIIDDKKYEVLGKLICPHCGKCV